MDWYTIDLVIKMTLEAAKKKQKSGKLIAMEMPFDWNDPSNYLGEEPETVHSLVKFYSGFLTTDDADLIELALYRKYPDYF